MFLRSQFTFIVAVYITECRLIFLDQELIFVTHFIQGHFIKQKWILYKPDNKIFSISVFKEKKVFKMSKYMVPQEVLTCKILLSSECEIMENLTFNLFLLII